GPEGRPRAPLRRVRGGDRGPVAGARPLPDPGAAQGRARPARVRALVPGGDRRPRRDGLTPSGSRGAAPWTEGRAGPPHVRRTGQRAAAGAGRRVPPVDATVTREG